MKKLYIEKSIKINQTIDCDDLRIALYCKTFDEIKDIPETEWKIIFYVSLLLLGIFTTLLNLSLKLNEEVIDSLINLNLLIFNPINISIILLWFIGLWGYLTILTMKMRYPPMFFTLKTIHNNFRLGSICPEFKVCDSSKTFNSLITFYNIGLVFWIPLLACIDITYISVITKMNKLWSLIPISSLFLICILLMIFAGNRKKCYEKLNLKLNINIIK